MSSTNQITTRKAREVDRWVRNRASMMGVKVYLDHLNEYLDDTIGAEAEFVSPPDRTTPEPAYIRVSTVRDPEDWVLNLLHELGHAQQWYTQSKEWQGCYIEGVDVSALADLWVNRRIELTRQQLDKVFMPLVRVELDAEMRMMGLCEKLRLPIPSQTIQKSWLYVTTYWWTSRHRMWLSPSREGLYGNMTLLEEMPKTLTFRSIRYNMRRLSYVLDRHLV